MGELPRKPLTRRELEVLQALAAGRTAPELAREWWVTVDTVKTHTKRIYRKLHARNAPHAVAIGFGAGLLKVAGDE